MTSCDSSALSNRFELLKSEYQICRRKLQSKCEALLILSRELDQCRSERDQFKLMAEQLRDRYQIVKRQLTGDMPILPTHTEEIDPKAYSDSQKQSLARLLFDTKEMNKSLKFEVDDLKQKLQDAEGDIKLLREQIARSRVGTTDEGMNVRHFPAHERETLVQQLETSQEKFLQLERDLQQVLDEKEELVTERDTYRTKHERLNKELNYILRGDENRIVDIDALSMENKFLQEKLKHIEEEKTMAIATVTKYKSILEKNKTKGILKLGQSRSGGLVITQKQVQHIMQSPSAIAPTPQALADLQGLCGALLDTINDKNLAISHQRKTNKLLGNRVSELEKKLKTLELSGLWSTSGNNNMSNLEKLKSECQNIKTLVPRQISVSSEASEVNQDASDLDSNVSSSLANSVTTSPSHHPHPSVQLLSKDDLKELDLLPTKEEVVKGDPEEDGFTSDAGEDNRRIRHSIDLLPGISAPIMDSNNVAEAQSASGTSTPSPGKVSLLKSLMCNECTDDEEVMSPTEWKESVNQYVRSNKNKYLSDIVTGQYEADGADDSVDISCVENGEEDDETNVDGHCLDSHVTTEGGDDEFDEEEEANEEFRALMECMTTKLLHQSRKQKGHLNNSAAQSASERRNQETVVPSNFSPAEGEATNITNSGSLDELPVPTQNTLLSSTVQLSPAANSNEESKGDDARNDEDDSMREGDSSKRRLLGEESQVHECSVIDC